MNEAISLLQKLSREHFYGRVEVNFRDGQIELLRKEETIKVKGATRDTQFAK
jgi:hypothetical protein